MNFRDQDDARIKVYEEFAPDRESVASKGGSIGGTQNINPYEAVGGVPMPYSYSAERDRGEAIRSATHNFPFELWKYNNEGKPLFANRFAERGLNPRFLFVDQTGYGDYKLTSSNLIGPDD